MRIVASQVGLASSRRASTSDFTKTTAEAWIGQRPSRPAATTTTPGRSGLTAAQIVDGMPGLAALRRAGPAAVASLSRGPRPSGSQQPASRASIDGGGGVAGSSGPSADDPMLTDPELRILALLVEALTGRKVSIIDPKSVRTDADPAAQQAGEQAAARVAQSAGAAVAGAAASAAAQQPAGWGLDVQVQQVHQESETTGYQATGQIVAADGSTINFDFHVLMHRDLVQTVQTEIQAGDAIKKVDPIALNLSGGPVALADTRAGFDINSDGTAENVALPAAGTYFLALDRNGNGAIDGGSELFGPSSGDGFAEMRALDTDGNGWIDEGDAAYASLRLWSGPAAGIQTLAQAGVGALYVGASTSTQFDLRSDTNETLGQVRASSVYLGEDGRPGALSQVDLTA